MSALTQQILEAASGLQEGEVLLPKEFLHLATRAAVDQALSRLTREGKLMRIGRGAYVAPVIGRFGPRPPSPEKTIESLAKKSGETVVANGAAAANALGLTTQVPVRMVFFTTGTSRKLRFGEQIVELKRAPSWQLTLGNSSAGTAIRALAWLGPQHVGTALAKVRQQLTPTEWNRLVASRGALPSWMAAALGNARG